MRRDNERGYCGSNYLKCYEAYAQSIHRLRKMWFIHSVKVAVGQAIDHIAESEEEKKYEYAFPKFEALYRREICDGKQYRYRHNRYLGNTELHSAYAQHI